MGKFRYVDVSGFWMYRVERVLPSRPLVPRLKGIGLYDRVRKQKQRTVWLFFSECSHQTADKTTVAIASRRGSQQRTRLAYRTRRCVYVTPAWARCSISRQSEWSEQRRCRKRPALEPSRRELSEDVWFGIGTDTLLVVQHSSLETCPRCVIYTVVLGRLALGITLF